MTYSTSAFTRYDAPERLPDVFAVPRRLELIPELGFFSSLTILGQILGCYLVCASSQGLALIDQHAAHERIAFEKLRRQLDDGKVAMQSLLIHQSVELTAGEMMLVEEKLDVLDPFGFSLEPFGPGAYAITAVAEPVPVGDDSAMRLQLLGALAL